MKPHEENWHADASGVLVITDSSGFLALDSHCDGDGPGRAKLAAQAPAMARLLLNADGDPEYMARVRDVLRDAGVLP